MLHESRAASRADGLCSGFSIAFSGEETAGRGDQAYLLAVSPVGLSLESRARSSTPSSSPSMYFVDAVIGGIERFAVGPWSGQQGPVLSMNCPIFFHAMKCGRIK